MNTLGPEDVGNWKKADNFGWHGRPDDADERALVYMVNRDSDILTRCNAEVIKEAMKPFIEDGSVTDEHHGHWACGWIDGYSIRVLQEADEEDGEKSGLTNIAHFVLTPAALKWNELAEKFNEYPILDESAYDDAIMRAIENLDEYDCRCIAERLGKKNAQRMSEKTIRKLEDFYEKAQEWVEE